MNWLIDLGNTRLKCAPLSAVGERGAMRAFTHTGDEEKTLAALLDFLGNAAGDAHIWFASVAPPLLTDHVVRALQAHRFTVHRVSSATQFGNLHIAYAEPSRLGVDRFLTLIAASQRHDGPWLIVSAGSALTLDLLDSQGTHLGGLIAPTPARMRQSLATHFTALNLPEGLPCDFAQDTADAVASGTHAAALGLVERSARLARERVGATPTVLLTGGGLAIFDALAHAPIVRLPALVLDGLAIFAQAREN